MTDLMSSAQAAERPAATVNGSLAVRLEQVLERRGQLAAGLSERLTQIRALRQVLQEVAGAAAQIEPSSLRAGAPAPAGTEVGPLLAEIDGACADLTAAAARFARGRINLGVLGQSGVGKSRFLRSLTALGQQAIPDQDGGATTGVPSVVRHGSPVRATVEFLTSEQYLARLLTYYDALGSATRPQTVAQFVAGTLPASPLDPAMDEIYRHLLTHHRHGTTTLQLLDQPAREIPLAQIAEYVTQEDSEGNPRGRHLAVARLVLTAEYPHGLAQVGVVDLPGLGDTNLTDRALVLESVRSDIDVLILVEKPSRDRALWGKRGQDLVDVAVEALPGLPLERRALLLLNEDRRPGNSNRKQCERLASTVAIPVADTRIVDAADERAVQQFFTGALGRIETMIAATDDALLADLHRSWGTTAQRIQDYLTSVSGVLGEGAGITDSWRIRQARTARLDLSRALREHAENPAHSATSQRALRAAYDAALERADHITEDFDLERFETLRHDLNGSKSLAYGSALDGQRARITSVFSSLDTVFNEELDRARDQLLLTLLQAGRLDGLIRGTGVGGWEALLRMLRDPRTDIPADSPLITAIGDLLGARLEHAAMLNKQINQALRLVSSNCPLYPAESLTLGHHEFLRDPAGAPRAEQAPDLWDTNLVDSAQFVELIRVTGAHALYRAAVPADHRHRAEHPAAPLSGNPDGLGVAGLLERDLTAPQEATVEVVRNFVTTVLNSPGAAEHWQSVYTAWGPQIWPGEFAAAAGRSQSLGALLESLHASNALLDELAQAVPMPATGRHAS